MEGLSPLHRRVAGIDVHHILNVVTVLIEQPDDSAVKHSLDGDLSERHLFVLRHLSESIDEMQRQLADIDACLTRAMQPYAWAHNLLQPPPPALKRPPPR